MIAPIASAMKIIGIAIAHPLSPARSINQTRPAGKENSSLRDLIALVPGRGPALEPLSEHVFAMPAQIFGMWRVSRISGQHELAIPPD